MGSYPPPLHLCIPELHDHLVTLQLPLVGCQQVLQGCKLRLQVVDLLGSCVLPPQSAQQSLLGILHIDSCQRTGQELSGNRSKSVY